MLKETFMDEYYKSLGEKEIRENPLKEIEYILKYYLKIEKKKIKKKR